MWQTLVDYYPNSRTLKRIQQRLARATSSSNGTREEMPVYAIDCTGVHQLNILRDLSLRASSKACVADLRFVGNTIDELIHITPTQTCTEIDLGLPTK